jgi:putative transport protein
MNVLCAHWLFLITFARQNSANIKIQNMNWFYSLFTDTASVAHIMLLFAIVIAVGVWLGKLKVGGISLGVAFVLFTGIIVGHIYKTLLPASDYACPVEVLEFMQNFGLMLFVYCVGLQVGPSFFESFKKGGLTLNMLAVGLVLLNVAVMLVLYYVFFDTNNPNNLPMMVGVLFGAVTNTPGLGAANEALSSSFHGAIPQIANGYACAYPLGVLGIIGATVLVRYICHVNLKKENEDFEHESNDNSHTKPHSMSLVVTNHALVGKNMETVRNFLGRNLVCTTILRGDEFIIPDRSIQIQDGDKLNLVCAEEDAEAIEAFIGKEVEVDWEAKDEPVVSRRVVVTRSEVNGKTLGQLNFNVLFGVNLTRVTRSGLEFFANNGLRLQIGDRVNIVGPQDAVKQVSDRLGNSVKRLDHPNVGALFIGIILGVLLGSFPIVFPGMPAPVRLGLAGGPLIVAILIGSVGYKVHIVSYTTTSANLFLREVGLVLFLAAVGIKAGAGFWQMIVAGDGVKYVWTGFLITVIPILIIGIIARMKFKVNYFVLSGVISGATTDPPALAFANATAGNDAPAIGYSTVYPLTMFLRILSAQILILFFCA